MKRWLVAIGIFIACELILLISGVGLWLLVRDSISFALVITVPAVLAVWLSKKIVPPDANEITREFTDTLR